MQTCWSHPNPKMEGEHSKRINMTAVITPKKYHTRIHTIFNTKFSQSNIRLCQVLFSVRQWLSSLQSLQATQMVENDCSDGFVQFNQRKHYMILLSHDYPMIIHYYPWFFPRLSLSGAMPVGISRGYEPGRILLQLPISQIGETVGDWNQMLEPSNFGIFYMCAILAFFKRT